MSIIHIAVDHAAIWLQYFCCNLFIKVSLSIFDLMGREIDMLINGNKPPGSYKFKWNATKHSSGVYFARLRLGPYVKTQKIILMK